MSMLARYKKPGGFQQLFLLLESCQGKKQETLLHHVEAENAQWAEIIRAKLLNKERFLALPAECISEIITRMPEKVLIFAFQGVPVEKREGLLSVFPHIKKKNILESANGGTAKAEEIEAAFLQIFKKIRDLENDKTLNLSKYAPEFALDEEKKVA